MRVIRRYGLIDITIDVKPQMLLVPGPVGPKIPWGDLLQDVLEELAAVKFDLQLSDFGISGYIEFDSVKFFRVAGMFGWVSNVRPGSVQSSARVTRYWGKILRALLFGTSHQVSLIECPQISYEGIVDRLSRLTRDLALDQQDLALADLIPDLCLDEPVFKE